MALTCVEKIIGLVIILIVFTLIFSSKSENFSSNKKHILIDNSNGDSFYLTKGTFEFKTDNKSSEIHTNKNDELQHYEKYVKINIKNQSSIITSDTQGVQGDFVPIKLTNGFLYYEIGADKYYLTYKKINVYGVTTSTSTWIKNQKPYGFDTFSIRKIN